MLRIIKFKRSGLIKNVLIFGLVVMWLLTGWPGIWLPGENGKLVRFPPSINFVYAATNTETFSSSTTWTVPAGVTSVVAECWGGGGGGSHNGSNTQRPGGGGGGGGYSKSNSVAVTSGSNYTVTVGAAVSAETAGNYTQFVGNSSQSCYANGGGLTTTRTGGTGASTAAPAVGDTRYGGGTGGTAGNTNGFGGGGGGEGACTTTTGNNGAGTSSATGGAGGNGCDGGDGGRGGDNSDSPTASTAGVAPGGGGGGSGGNVNTGKGGAAGQIMITYTIYTDLGNGTDGGNSTIGPGGSATEIDRFSFAESTGTDTVTGLTVTLAPANAYTNVATVDVQTTVGTSKCSTSSVTSNTVTLSSCNISVTTTRTEYKIMVTPKTHANMDPPSTGQSYATTATVTDFTVSGTSTKSGTDSGSATITIDNLSPNSATGTSGTPGNQNVTLNWTSSNSSDFDTTNGSVILRWTSGSAGSEVPAEGNSSYVAGNTISTATVACVISSAISTSLSKTDGSGGSAGCTTSALTNGQQYTYKVFQRDVGGNYDVGILIGTFVPSTPTFIQNDFRWYIDENTLTLTDLWPVGTLDLAENAVFTQLPAENLPLVSGDKIRIQINVTVSTANLSAGGQAFQVEYVAATDCTTAVGWASVGAIGGGTIWRFFDNTSLSDGANQVNQISTSSAGAEGRYIESNPTGTNLNAVNASQNMEWDFAVENNGAAENTTYCFRIAKSGGTVLDTYNSDSYPKLTTAPGTTNLMRNGNFFSNDTKQGFFWAN